MLVLTARDLDEVLGYETLIPAMAEAMDELSRDVAIAPNRTGVSLDSPNRLLAAMPGYTPASSALGTKLVTLYPDNAARELPSHQALVVLFDVETGSPAALLDGTLITEMRTAACSALATDLLARRAARVHAVLGTGAQAFTHAVAVSTIRQIDELRICGRDFAKAAALAERLSDAHGLPARPVESWPDAFDGADIVSATTHTAIPVVTGDRLGPGMHVNSVGFNTAGREIDNDAIARSITSVDTLAAAAAPPPAGTRDIAEPIADGIVDADDILELGDLAASRVRGRTDDGQITIYKSVGVAVQDCATAALAVATARARGLGQDVNLR